jgi:hypothetical protein
LLRVLDELSNRHRVRPPVRQRRERRVEVGSSAIGRCAEQAIVTDRQLRFAVPLGEATKPPLEPFRSDVDGSDLGHLPEYGPVITGAVRTSPRPK